MDVGEVRVAEDNDFEVLKIYLNRNDGWQLEYKRGLTKIWTRYMPDSSDFRMMRVITVLPDVPAAVLYDVLHDSEYRNIWDHYMLDIRVIGHLNPNNNISYYALSCPPPMKNRDFVIQSSWLETSKEYMIINHSVFHKSCPPRNDFIRATSFFTGFLLRAQEGGQGTWLGYVTHSNPKGKLPSWAMNRLSSSYAPRLIKRLRKACIEYPRWKMQHGPSKKYWLFPEQIASTPKIDLADCRPPDMSNNDPSSLEEIDQFDQDFGQLDEDSDNSD